MRGQKGSERDKRRCGRSGGVSWLSQRVHMGSAGSLELTDRKSGGSFAALLEYR